jgi:hypothetical protein
VFGFYLTGAEESQEVLEQIPMSGELYAWQSCKWALKSDCLGSDLGSTTSPL